MDDSVVISYVSILLSVGSAIIMAVNHKRIRSSCCGRKAEMSIDIENTTPPKISIPQQECSPLQSHLINGQTKSI
jgi:hypothetical protein